MKRRKNMKAEEICTATIKLTEHELEKLIWCMKAVQNMLSVFEIMPEHQWTMKLDTILEDLEKVANNIKEAKIERINDKQKAPDPKKEYIDKITG
jgi:molybdenum cofactor biosynthesis enzyme MoaA